jgi:V-type H+-transporting ATPase subunit A
MNLLGPTMNTAMPTDVAVYVGCGLRSIDVSDQLWNITEMTTVLPEIGRHISMTARTVVVCNATNSPLAAREAAVHTGLAIAEYLRDQGCDVSLHIDNLFRWALAQPRQLSPDTSQQLKEQLGAMYERAGRFVCEGTPAREGSITLLGVVGGTPGGSWSAVNDVAAASRAVAQTV